MPVSLEKRELTAELLDDVTDFYCGDEPWAREVADWLRDSSRQGALAQVSSGRCKVWLYYAGGGELVG
jgi:hypothetical protein